MKIQLQKEMGLYLKTFFYCRSLGTFPFFIREISTCVGIANFYTLSSTQDMMSLHSKSVEHC